VILDAESEGEGLQDLFAELEEGGAAAGADGVEKVDEFLRRDRRAMAISAGLSSGKEARMARARVTTPLTPNAMSSARS
jgi:hypothetical protein